MPRGWSAARSSAPASLLLLLEQLQEAILERLVPWLDRVDAAALADDLRDELRHAFAGEAAERQPFALVLQVPEFAKLGPAAGGQSRHPDSDRAVLSQNLRHRSGRDHPAVVDHGEAVADLLDLGQQVRVEKHRGAARLQGADDLAYVVTPYRVERRGGLVEQGPLGAAEQGDTEAQPLLHTLGEALHLVVRPFGETDELEGAGDLGSPFGARHAGTLAVQSQHFSRFHPALVAKQLRQVAEASPGLQIAGRRAKNPGLTGGRVCQADQ